jgi:hypothetical protein
MSYYNPLLVFKFVFANTSLTLTKIKKMKKLILFTLLLFLPLMSFGQEDIERFKLYPTTNMWTFLELDTATGLVWQVQYSADNDNERFKTILNDIILNDSEQLNGRWKLYPTQNMYQFLLVDVMGGAVIQIQWSTDDNRGIVGYIE